MIESGKSSLILATVGLGAMVLFAACSEHNVQPPNEAPFPDSTGHRVSETIESHDKMNLTQQLEFSKAELSQRLDIEAGMISVAGVRKVNWRSGALGCPSPGMSYTEALVPGILILLHANGKAYGYHAKVGGKPFFCPPERVEKPASIQAEDLA